MPPNICRLSIFFSSLLCFFFLPCFSLDEQGQALLSWKSQLNISGDALSSWNVAATSPCNWVGVKCNRGGEVSEIQVKGMDLQGSPSVTSLLILKSLTSLTLSSLNLTGVIPKEIGDFTELELLDLSDNSLSGDIPVEIFTLKKLKTLSLNTNNLEGPIPTEIGNLTDLVELMLFDNKLSGEIPRSIGELKNLQFFRAGGNKNLRGELPWEIGNCENLVMLGLAETSLSGSLPASIGNLKLVHTIAIYTSLLSGPIPDEIGNCTELQNLYLYQNSISGSIPTTVGGLKKLQSLLLWQNSLIGKIPTELGNCPELWLIDFSENLITGYIPRSFGKLENLQELQLSVNQISGTIPEELMNCTKLTHLEIDNNLITGEIPSLMSNLRSLTMFFAWQNKLTGNIPKSLSQCRELQAIDLSYNTLSGPIPKEIFGLQNLTKLLLLSNDLSGFIPPDVGNCTNLYRLRLNGNRLAGSIPSEIGNLENLNFVDMSENRLVGIIPPAISGCESLEFLDLHSNSLSGSLLGTLPKSLKLIDFSDNALFGPLPPGIGLLTELTKLNLAKNRFSGEIPREISTCQSLQLLNLGENAFSGEIPDELGQIPSLAISLNLSCNEFVGAIPSRFSDLKNLGVLDVSHNRLTGNLIVLTDLQNLVSLNVSFNDFSGDLPDTPFFRKLPLSDLASNKGLYISNAISTRSDPTTRNSSVVKLTILILIVFTAVLILLAVYTLVRARIAGKQLLGEEIDSWEVTLYQKLDFSIDDIVKNLTSANVIGTGSSGVVYRITIPSGESLAVKKMWSKEESGAFNSEIKTLGSIRHRNIVRLLGWCTNRNLKLLFYDYLPNGSLSSRLHGAGKGGSVDWEARYDVVLGVAHALAYLHHDCLPAIIHGDVKAMNVLLGPHLEPYLADFGLARTVSGYPNTGIDLSKPSNRPPLAGSYGYMAPEHASMQLITERSDVYSYGVVLLEVLTGKHPLDPDLPGGAHLVKWVRDHLAEKKDPSRLLDPRLIGRTDLIMHEMIQTLAVAFLCVSNKANERPLMKDVVAMLTEIREVDVGRSETGKIKSEGCGSKEPQQLMSNEKIIISHGSSNCSFAFSDDSV
ncbi:PREDICTED: probable LRR receptor-like serine/threonine-protein kinase At4g26540 [Camelina sativa]|uniref:Probable LRR receptor-like serine/threonine-protein kinase At4g26540 n=1 Tax=Camelina sativa TaxID=90675 RepID=A0ABM0UBJ1_CAMSA|nr:PREDICTED: probable LRR receptor-like serine/threonine-protein kinase At4g26540 [Camelina sativa]